MRGPRLPVVRPALRALARLAVACVVAVPALSGCGAVDAEDEPFAGTIVYQDPGGAFAVRLLQPPWLPPLSTEGTTIFVVPPANATVTADLSVVLDEALYSLDITLVASTPVALSRALSASLPPAAMAAEAPAGTASGATGLEVSWQELRQGSPQESAGGELRYHRDVFLAGPATHTYQLSFVAKRAIEDDAMVDQMITSFVPYL
jgi:hypothetical protein